MPKTTFTPMSANDLRNVAEQLRWLLTEVERLADSMDEKKVAAIVAANAASVPDGMRRIRLGINGFQVGLSKAITGEDDPEETLRQVKARIAAEQQSQQPEVTSDEFTQAIEESIKKPARKSAESKDNRKRKSS